MKVFTFFFLFGLSFLSKSTTESDCIWTTRGYAKPWQANKPLIWDDFKAAEKRSKGFAIASASCNFGYDLVDGQISLFVRFYCDESWKNDYLIEEVLAHEQLHFDICEIYGRKFHKALIEIKSQNKLTSKTIKKVFNQLQEEYDAYQDLYDLESDHSMNGTMQRHWNNKVKRELKELKEFKKYKEFKSSINY